MAKSPNPFAVKSINSLPILMVQIGSKGSRTWQATITDFHYPPAYRFVVVGAPDGNTAIAKIRLMIKQILTKPGTLKFENCCCQYTYNWNFPVVPRQHPNYNVDTSSFKTGLRVLQCVGCGEIWTQAFRDCETVEEDFNIWQHWGSDPDKVGISFYSEAEKWYFVVKGRKILVHMMPKESAETLV